MLPHSKESDFVLFLLGCGEISLASMTIFFEPLEPPVRNKNERSEFAIHYAEKIPPQFPTNIYQFPFKPP